MGRSRRRGRRRAPIVIPTPDLLGPPGSVVPPAGEPPPRLHVFAYDAARFEEREVESVAALRALRTGPILWVNIEGVGDAATFQALGRAFGLHPLALEDVVHLHQRPKAEDFDDHAYVVLQMPKGEDLGSLEQLSLFFGTDFVITVQEGAPGDCLDPIRQRLRTGRGRIRRAGADYLAYLVIDAVIDAYFPVVERLNERLEALEEQIADAVDDAAVTEIHAVRHELHQLRRVLVSSREALSQLLRGETGPIAESTLPFLRDGVDHTAQLLDAVEALRELQAGLMDLHLARASHHMNEVMKVLTLIATIFIPLSFIAGVYGMNFDRSVSPWNMPELGWVFGYPFALALMLGTTLTFLVYFRRRGWLGRRHRRKRPPPRNGLDDPGDRR